MKTKLTLILDNIRSAQNVGSLLRSADAFGAAQVICVGITPYPARTNDSRLPHVAAKATRDIAKTALGAEQTMLITHYQTIQEAIDYAKTQGAHIYGLEQANNSTPLQNFAPLSPCALILGNEVTGIDQRILGLCEEILEIPMLGLKESLNVSVAGGIALYALSLSKSDLSKG